MSDDFSKLINDFCEIKEDFMSDQWWPKAAMLIKLHADSADDVGKKKAKLLLDRIAFEATLESFRPEKTKKSIKQLVYISSGDLVLLPRVEVTNRGCNQDGNNFRLEWDYQSSEAENVLLEEPLSSFLRGRFEGFIEAVSSDRTVMLCVGGDTGSVTDLSEENANRAAEMIKMNLNHHVLARAAKLRAEAKHLRLINPTQ